MKENLVKYYKIVRENLTMIALIPTIFGAIWQLFKLGDISIQMIRFFSISQLLNDGIIFLIFLFIPVMFLVLFLNLDMKNFYSDEKYSFKTYLKENKMNKFKVTFYSICISMYFALVISTRGTILFKTYFFFLFIIHYLLFQFLVFTSLFQFFRRHGLIQSYFIISSLFLFIICIVVTNENLLKTNTFENAKKIISKLEKEKCYSKEPKILYFNDKYIFIELEEKGVKTIDIKKFDAFFED